MLKEIYEQPAVIGDTLNSFINPSTGEITLPDNIIEAVDKAPRLTLIACGTAYYACMVAKYWFEQIVRIPCEIDIASEFRYREAPLPEGGLEHLCVSVRRNTRYARGIKILQKTRADYFIDCEHD